MKMKKEDVRFLMADGLKQSKQIYDGAILQLYVNDIELENGAVVERELIHHKPAVCILAIKKEQEEQVVLVKQYRPAIDEWIYEVPAGIIDDEDPSHQYAAERELEEETDYKAHQWHEIASFYVSPGFLDEKITLFKATGLEKVANPLPQDDNENVESALFTKEEIKQMIQQGEIVDLKTLHALQYWLGE
ncbi:NUDIX hydrolase [Dolosicoccus paucivorans]|nr:NUDIX hydrolase [Dolosicoccus paucivorans]SDI52200.1 ADP-ribose pyrophosphatase [Dolosicoccus paucivorans]